MATYKSRQINFFNEVDEIGSKYSLARLSGETVESFEDRVMYQCRASHTAKIEDIGSYINNCLGRLEQPMLEIVRTLDSNGNELYPHSYIKIDSYYIIIIEDAFEEKEVRFEYRKCLDFSEIKDYINSTGIFTCSAVDGADIDEYDSAYKLKCESNLHYEYHNFVQKKVTEVEKKNIIYFDLNINEKVYNKVDSFEEVEREGDYYIDTKRGKLAFFEEVSGSVIFGYADFPFYLKKQNVKISSCREESFNHLIKEDIIEEGKVKKIKLNQRGVEFYNDLFKSFSNHWDT